MRMPKLLPVICCGLCLLLGLSVGWYFGYTQPSIKRQRELLQEYRRVRDGFGLSDKDMAEIAPQLPKTLEQLNRADESAAAVSLGVLVKLDLGEQQAARQRLYDTVGLYYRGHHSDGDTNLLARIQKYASIDVGLSNAVYKTSR